MSMTPSLTYWKFSIQSQGFCGFREPSSTHWRGKAAQTEGGSLLVAISLTSLCGRKEHRLDVS
jgi:hypothetical protein